MIMNNFQPNILVYYRLKSPSTYNFIVVQTLAPTDHHSIIPLAVP